MEGLGSPSLLLERPWALGVSRRENCQCVCVPKDRTIRGFATRDQGSPGQLWVCVHVHVRICVSAGSAPATGVGLQPQGLICPDDSNWGDWDPGAAAGQTECLSLAAGGIQVVCVYIYVFLLVYLLPAQLGRGVG